MRGLFSSHLNHLNSAEVHAAVTVDPCKVTWDPCLVVELHHPQCVICEMTTAYVHVSVTAYRFHCKVAETNTSNRFPTNIITGWDADAPTVWLSEQR